MRSLLSSSRVSIELRRQFILYSLLLIIKRKNNSSNHDVEQWRNTTIACKTPHEGTRPAGNCTGLGTELYVPSVRIPSLLDTCIVYISFFSLRAFSRILYMFTAKFFSRTFYLLLNKNSSLKIKEIYMGHLKNLDSGFLSLIYVLSIFLFFFVFLTNILYQRNYPLQ